MWPPYGHPHKSSATVVSCIIKMAIMRLILWRKIVLRDF